LVSDFRVYGLGLGAWSIGFKTKIKNVGFEAIEFRMRNADELNLERETRNA
jgi:hypothetical protein